MSALAGLSAFFLAPSSRLSPVPGGTAPTALADDSDQVDDRAALPSRRRRGADRPAPPTVAVVGDAAAAVFAADLAVALAGRHRRRCGLLAVWGATAPPAPRGHATRAAELVAVTAATVPGSTVTTGGRGVIAALPPDPDAARAAQAALVDTVGDDALLVLAICGPRSDDLDAVLATHDVVVLVLAPAAPDALSALATASLDALVPRAIRVTLIMPGGAAVPRPLRHRAAIRHVLEALA